MKWTRPLTFLGLTLLGLNLASPAFGQASPKTTYLRQATVSEAAGTIHIVANSPRPLEQVLEALQQKYGWVVDYEDPRFTSKSDLVETEITKLPAGGSFSVEFPSSAPAEEKTLQLIVDAYNHSDNPGRFELRKSKQGDFAVVGTQARDVSGKLANQSPLLDGTITLPTKARTVSETVELIIKKLALQHPVSVKIGVVPRSMWSHTQVTVGGTKTSARELLIQTLGATHRTLYWRLLFDPNSKGYVLDVHMVRPT